jgi:hypothetical protein
LSAAFRIDDAARETAPQLCHRPMYKIHPFAQATVSAEQKDWRERKGTGWSKTDQGMIRIRTDTSGG